MLKVNTLMRIDADYVGAPEPKVTWFKPNGDVLTADDYYDVEAQDDHTRLVVRRCQRKDTGIYKITAKNSEGSDEADVEVLVVSVPEKPMGPIWVTDVTAHTCHLEWKPPKVSDISDLSAARKVGSIAAQTHRTAKILVCFQMGKAERPHFFVHR